MLTPDEEDSLSEILLKNYLHKPHEFEELLKWAGRIGTGTLRLNFTGIMYINSRNISQLTALRKLVVPRGGKVVFSHVVPTVYKDLKVFAFDQLCEIELADDEQGAE